MIPMTVIASCASEGAAASAPVCTDAALPKELDLIAEPWVSVEDVAKHLGVAKDSIYRWIETKGLPAKRMGRLWKFKVSEVDAWVQAGGAEIVPGSNYDDADTRGGRHG